MNKENMHKETFYQNFLQNQPLKDYREKVSAGKIMNDIQALAEEKLTEAEFEEYLEKANRDISLCKLQDCLLLNGQVFDWKEFDSKKDEIVLAFLDYFTPMQLGTMLLEEE